MYVQINIAKMVETTLLRRIFVLIRLAHCVAVGPSYEILSPPSAMRTLCVSVLLVLIDTKICTKANLLPAGTPDRWMKKMVFVLLMRFPTPCFSLPM